MKHSSDDNIEYLSDEVTKDSLQEFVDKSEEIYKMMLKDFKDKPEKYHPAYPAIAQGAFQVLMGLKFRFSLEGS